MILEHIMNEENKEQEGFFTRTSPSAKKTKSVASTRMQVRANQKILLNNQSKSKGQSSGTQNTSQRGKIAMSDVYSSNPKPISSQRSGLTVGKSE